MLITNLPGERVRAAGNQSENGYCGVVVTAPSASARQVLRGVWYESLRALFGADLTSVADRRALAAPPGQVVPQLDWSGQQRTFGERGGWSHCLYPPVNMLSTTISLGVDMVEGILSRRYTGRLCGNTRTGATR